MNFYQSLYNQTPPESQLRKEIAEQSITLGDFLFQRNSYHNETFELLMLAAHYFPENSAQHAGCITLSKALFEQGFLDENHHEAALIFLAISDHDDVTETRYYQHEWRSYISHLASVDEATAFLHKSLYDYEDQSEAFLITAGHYIQSELQKNNPSLLLQLAERMLLLTDDHPEIQADWARHYHLLQLAAATKVGGSIAYQAIACDLADMKGTQPDTPRHELIAHYLELEKFEDYRDIYQALPETAQDFISDCVQDIHSPHVSHDQRMGKMIYHAQRAIYHENRREHDGEVVHATIMSKALQAWPTDPESPYNSIHQRAYMASLFLDEKFQSTFVYLLMNKHYMLYSAINDCSVIDARITDHKIALETVMSDNYIKSQAFSKLQSPLSKPH